ncbi:MAG: hypothetical protein ACOY0R_04625 [Chloroflexota bacterium]
MNQTQRPTLVTIIAAMTLASGIVNVFWGAIASQGALASVVGFVCVPFTILPTVLGIFEILYAAKLFGAPGQAARPSTSIAAFEIATILAGNAFSMVVGILALVFYNDLAVKGYFDGMTAPGPAPVEPAPSQPED